MIKTDTSRNGHLVFLCRMFIEVCDDVLRKALRPSDKENIYAVEALRQLAWAILKRHHLVFFPSLTFDDIKRLGDVLDKNEIAAILHSFSRKNDLLVLSGMLQFKVVVSFEKESGRDGGIIKIKPGRESVIELYEECHLLTENLLDADFYRHFAVAYQKNNRIDVCAFRISFYSLQGGGATTGQVFLYECRLGQHLCLAILDSDKKWPNFSGYGPTAHEFINDYNEYLVDNSSPLACHYYVMEEVNEIENLIPIVVLKVHSSSKQKSFIDHNLSAMPWFDIKKGFDYRSLYDKQDAFDEWKKLFLSNPDWNLLESLKMTSKDSDDFLSKVKDAKFNSFIDGWGSPILDNVLYPKGQYKNKYSLKNVNLNILTPEQRKEWLVIGSLVFNWCCCFGNTVY